MLHDSPVIREIEATGTWEPYPRLKRFTCPDCGGTMSGEIEIYELDEELLCEPCFLDKVRSMSAKELADRLDIASYTANDIIRLEEHRD